jgi:hypothetical protein
MNGIHHEIGQGLQFQVLAANQDMRNEAGYLPVRTYHPTIGRVFRLHGSAGHDAGWCLCRPWSFATCHSGDIFDAGVPGVLNEIAASRNRIGQ